MKPSTNRRTFLKTASIGSALAVTLPGMLSEALAAEKGGKIKLMPGDTVLFQGDSITDAGRSKTDVKNFNTPSILGTGYAFLAAAELLQKNADKKLKIYNRGISGNKVYQLAARWDADCIDLKPNVLSILIGVNDYWHLRNKTYDGTVERYETDYRALLQRTKQALPDVKLVICEPFAVPGGTAVDNTWFPPLTGYQDVSRKLAGEFNAVFVPYQSVFNKASQAVPGTYWTPDGVHPSLAGAKLMAQAWLEAVVK